MELSARALPALSVRFEVLSRANSREALECVNRVFTSAEPMTRHLGVTLAEFRKFSEPLLEHLLPQGLSWVARDSATGEVVGARLIEDLARPFKAPRLGLKMRTILAFLEEISEPIGELEPTPVRGRILHAHIVAVDERAWGRGVGRGLLVASSAEAFHRGYRRSYGEITSQANLRLALRSGACEVLTQLPYRGFEFQGLRPFDSMSPLERCSLVRLDLQRLHDHVP